jgi:hypothetical protein
VFEFVAVGGRGGGGLFGGGLVVGELGTQAQVLVQQPVEANSAALGRVRLAAWWGFCGAA